MFRLTIKNIGFFAVALFFIAGCSKVEYEKVDDPVYLRVFNSLNYFIGPDNKDEQVPFLTMLIDPVLDANGMPVSAAIKGDFLDKRDPYAPPYPSHVGNSNSVNNPEYPGKENVLVGPVVNGFDLSSWAQIPAGKHRIMFLYRPKNAIPFFNLDEKLKRNVVVDTTLVLDSREIYTLQVLQKDFDKKTKGVYLRKENFHKLPLSDNEVYVNFYNLSSKGFWQADASKKEGSFVRGAIQFGVKDQMNVYLSLYHKNNILSPVPGFKGKFFAEMSRNLDGKTAPYSSFPLFADPLSNGITTDVWQRLDFLTPAMDLAGIPYGIGDIRTDNNWVPISFYSNGKIPVDVSNEGNADLLPNMIVNIHSGQYNPRSFGTVNTVEIINGFSYLMTVQRKYAPPVY